MVGLPDVVLYHGHHTRAFMPHAHEVATVILITRGSVEIEVDAKRYSVATGELVAIGSRQVHAARPLAADGWEMRSMHLPAGLIAGRNIGDEEAFGDVVFARPVISGGGRAGQFLHFHRLSEASADAALQLSSLCEFAASLREMASSRPAGSSGNAIDARVDQARQMMEQTVVENLPIESIAEQVELSVFALIRRFRQAYGLPPHAWRMQARANAAADYLRARASLIDAAMSCGFYDQSHMARVFKKVFGVTPGQYSLMY